MSLDIDSYMPYQTANASEMVKCLDHLPKIKKLVFEFNGNILHLIRRHPSLKTIKVLITHELFDIHLLSNDGVLALYTEISEEMISNLGRTIGRAELPSCGFEWLDDFMRAQGLPVQDDQE